MKETGVPSYTTSDPRDGCHKCGTPASSERKLIRVHGEGFCVPGRQVRVQAMSVPEEAVEAAARAMFFSMWEPRNAQIAWEACDDQFQNRYREHARAALSAAYPAIRDQVLAEQQVEVEAGLSAREVGDRESNRKDER